MKLISFRIQNYKSIKDSGECYLERNITIFAGKNGSGKSNVLEALSKFTNHSFDFMEDNYNYESERPIITNKYILEENELKYIEEKFEVSIDKEVVVKLDMNSNDGFVYDVKMNIDLCDIMESNRRLIERIRKETGDELLEFGDTIEEVTINYDEQTVETAKNAIEESGFIDVVELNLRIQNYILEKIPQFVYKKTIENELTSIITKESIKANDFHKDISKLLKLTESDFDQNADKSGRMRRGSTLSKTLTGDFGAFYNQDKIELRFALDADSITMGVIEPDKAYGYENKIENKSDGLKWFIAFYVKLNVMKNKNVIILLDEPGMYLHARACEEMLKIFHDISSESQILLATHNPYLIKSNNLGAVRLVLNAEKSTVVENKPHKYNQDKNMDALTPILTSIGYELTMSIHVGDQKSNLITEGISDYYFLNGMAKILSKSLDYLIIPSSSADKINYIASILIGWGLNTIALLDSDKKGKKKEEELAPLVDKCVFISETDNLSIEDLFSKEDYCMKILELENIQETDNSVTKKSLKIDEVLKAKQFCEKASNNEISLSEETITNFEALFDKIQKSFENITK